MNNTTNKMAAIGMINVTTMAISKGVAFVGGILLVAGMGGMVLSQKCFTEAEMKYLTKHVTTA